MPAVIADLRRAGSVKRMREEGWLLLAVASASIILYWPSLAWLSTEWTSFSGTFGHGYLVAVICMYLLWRVAQGLNARTCRPFWPATVLVAGLSFIWLLGYSAHVAAVHTTLVPFICLAAVWAALGSITMRHAAFPMLYLLLGMTAWEHLAPAFQAITLNVVHVLIRTVDVPVYVEGSRVFIPSGSFEIEDGCSGLRYLLAGVGLASLYGYAFYSRARERVILVLAVVAAALISNWLRVFGIIIIGHASRMQSPIVHDHVVYGWLLFFVFMIPILFIARRLESTHQTNQPVATSERATFDVRPATGGRVGTIAAICVLSAGPIWAIAVDPGIPTPGNRVIELPDLSPAWRGPHATEVTWRPRFAGPSAERIAAYRAAGPSVLVYTNLYVSQDQDRELVYYDNSVAGDWTEISSGIVTAAQIDPESVAVNQVIAQGAGGRWLVWYWYEIDGKRIISATGAKIRQALATLRGRPEAGLTAFATRCEPSCELAAVRLQQFLHDWNSNPSP